MADSSTSTQLPVDIESAISELESTQFGRKGLDTPAIETGYLGDDVFESEDDIEGELSSEAKEMLAAIENSAESLTAEIAGENKKAPAPEDSDLHVVEPDEVSSALPDIIPETPDEEPSIGEVAKEAMIALDKEAIEKEVDIAVRNSVEKQVEEQVGSAIKKALAESIDALVAASVEQGVARAVGKAMEEVADEEKLEKALMSVIEKSVEQMKPQLLSVFRKVAADATLNVAEDMVRQTIEQIKTGN